MQLIRQAVLAPANLHLGTKTMQINGMK